MTTHNDLTEFIAHARKKEMDHATIRMLLVSSGWKEKDVMQALTEQALDMPVPLPPDTGGAREAFFHLLTFGSLYATLTSAILLFFDYISMLFPDVAMEGVFRSEDWRLQPIRWSMATMIVAFPLLLWMSRKVFHDMMKNPERAVSAIRRWLTYLTLLVASIVSVTTLITLIFWLLEGELSVRFLLKVAVILTIAVLTFVYYITSLRLRPDSPAARKLHRTFLLLAAIMVVVALAWGGWVIGSPAQERVRKLDEQRMSDLQALANGVYQVVYKGLPKDPAGTLTESLPKTVNEVIAQSGITRVNDPETGAPYVYRVIDVTHFEVCAVFALPGVHQYDSFWDHPAGEKCFSFDVKDRQHVN